MMAKTAMDTTKDQSLRQASELQRIETHVSRVYLGDELVWKTKKPVDLGFLDFSTAELRRAVCEAEVELNRRLAPGVYLGVVPVLRREGRLWLPEDPGARVPSEPVDDWAVLMRRVPDAARADRLLDAGRLGRGDLERVAARLARFHDAARCDEETERFGSVEVIRGNVEENFEQTREFIGDYLADDDARQLRDWQLDFLDRHGDRFDERVQAGRVRDGHGDLRLEHVYLDLPEPADDVVVLDCIEFNERFRFADVCADVAFLSMDLSGRRRPDLAEAFLAAYAREAQDYDLYPLVDFYESYRAFVRAKVAAFVAREDSTPRKLRRRKAAEAREHFLLALSSGRRSLLPPRLVAVGGWIGAGKSTTAQRVSEILDAPIVDADRTRKHLLGVDEEAKLHVEPWSGPYSEDMTDRTYGELLRRGGQILASGRSAVLDATFRSRRQRLDARAVAAEFGVPFLFVECRADADVCRHRLESREGGPSDGRLEIFDDFVAGYEDVGDELDPDQLLALDTGSLTPEQCATKLRERLPSAPRRLG